jgi:hypothetical protein
MKVTTKKLSKLLDSNYEKIDQILSRHFGIELSKPEIKYVGRLGSYSSASPSSANVVANEFMMYKGEDDSINISIGAFSAAGKYSEDIVLGDFGHELGHRYHFHIKPDMINTALKQDRLWERMKELNFNMPEFTTPAVFERIVSPIYFESVGYNAEMLTAQSLNLTIPETSVDKQIFLDLWESGKYGNIRILSNAITKEYGTVIASDLMDKTGLEFQTYCRTDPVEALIEIDSRIRYINAELGSVQPKDSIEYIVGELLYKIEPLSKLT